MNEEHLKELQAIKKLLALSLIKQGITSDDIGKTIGVHGRTIRAWIPEGRKLRKR